MGPQFEAKKIDSVPLTPLQAQTILIVVGWQKSEYHHDDHESTDLAILTFLEDQWSQQQSQFEYRSLHLFFG